MQFIKSHQTDELKKVFEKLPRPSGTKLAEAVSQVLEVIPESALGVKVGPIQRALKQIGDSRRVRAAAWRWITPDAEPDDADRLVDLQRKAGLAHLPHAEFCQKLVDVCASYAEKQPLLSRFIDARIVEIEFNMVADKTSSDFETMKLEPYQRALLRAAMASTTSPDDAHTLANQILSESLATAAAAIASVLDEKYGQKGCVVSANLMFPIETGPTIDSVPVRLGSLASTRPAEKADELWRDVRGQLHRAFVVVAESPGPSRIGFWVPDVRHKTSLVPGAPRAFNNDGADAVFSDDLELFPGDDEVTDAKWQRYLGGGNPDGFLGRMFVSVPVRARVSEKQFVPVAVVNINVDGNRIWKRAYSRAWLERATRVATPWIATAWHAFGITHELEQASEMQVASGVLPFAGVLHALPAPTPSPLGDNPHQVDNATEIQAQPAEEDDDERHHHQS